MAAAPAKPDLGYSIVINSVASERGKELLQVVFQVVEMAGVSVNEVPAVVLHVLRDNKRKLVMAPVTRPDSAAYPFSLFLYPETCLSIFCLLDKLFLQSPIAPSNLILVQNTPNGTFSRYYPTGYEHTDPGPYADFMIGVVLPLLTVTMMVCFAGM